MKLLADRIAETREYIEKNGWWRKSNFGPNGKQVCLRGGVIRSQGWEESHWTQEQHEIYESMEDAISEAVGDVEYFSLTSWNDDMAVNKQHVLDTLAKAEKISRTGFDPDHPDRARFDPEAP